MKVHRQLLFGLMLFCILGLAACQPGIAPTRAIACNTQFEATVHHGPNAGMAVTGTLLFALNYQGEISGVVATNDGNEIVTSGQANGRAINLTFKVGDRKYLFGVGSAENPIYTCSGYWGGSFTGPEPGDSGDWLASDGVDVTIQTQDTTIDPNISLNTGSGTLTNGGSPDIPQNFTCGEYTCRCDTTDDCKRLAESGICKTSFRQGSPNQVCTYRDQPSRRQDVEE
ncbi:MAG: hypothetical protein U0175_23350 [Caldilineaceae bacterium]